MADTSNLIQLVRVGKLDKIRNSLQSKPKEEVVKIINEKVKIDGTDFDGATPLIVASRYGYLSIVRYFLDDCSADVELTGSVTFDGEKIEGAPPLWCASAAGHLAVVKLLMSSGAKVNCTTSTNSTPLRAACFDGHHDIVKFLISNNADIEIANRHGHTCLMISCYKGHETIVRYLVEKGADVNRCSLKGNTALHDCAESGNLGILKYLLDAGAKITKDCYNMTPLLAAAVTGHTNVVQYLSESTECKNTEMIDALELLGATFIDKKRDITGGLNLWKQAMEKRSVINQEKVVTEKRNPAYGNSVEAVTVSELQDLMADPDEMRMQALLVRERILGPAHPDTSYYIRYRGAVYADLGDFGRCISLWRYALEMQQQNLDPLSLMTQSSFLSFAELFSFMGERGMFKSERVRRETMFIDMLFVFERAISELQAGQKLQGPETTEKERQNYNRLQLIIMHLLSLICGKLEYLTEEESCELKKLAYKFVHLKPLGANGGSLLHLACSKETSNVGKYQVCKFPSLSVVNLLLEVGASTNAVDSQGNTPLHLAAMNKPLDHDIIKTLLHHGAHFDCKNKEGSTFSDLAKSFPMYSIVCPLDFISLQCLAARTLRENNIEYESQVSKRLSEFVDLH